MLLMAPIAQMIYAEDTGIDETGDETGEETEDSEDGDETGNGNGNIDPEVYEQIKQDTNEMYDQLFNLVFGQTEEVEDGDTETGEETGEEETGEEETGEGDDEENGYLGPEIPEDTDAAIRNQFVHAWMAMQQAENMEGENMQAAAQQYLRAMKQLRNAFRKYQKKNPEIVDELTPEEEPTVEEEPMPTVEDLEETKQQLLGRFTGALKDAVADMLLFYESVEDDLDPDDAVKAYNALIHAERKLLRIQERINAGVIDGAIDDLEETGEDLVDGYDEMDDDSAQLFKTATKLQTKIERMIEKRDRKAARGEDVSGYDDLIDQFNGNIDKAKNEHKENKGKGKDGNNGNGKGKGKKDK